MSLPDSFPKNPSSVSLKPEISQNPSSATNQFHNNNSINKISLGNNNGQINEEKDEDTDNNNEEKEIDEIAEEEDENDDKNKEKENEEIQLLNANQNEKTGKIAQLFIYLRTGFVWRPIPKIQSTMLCLEISGGIFIIIGIVILILSNQIKEIEIRYDNNPQCIIGERCDINFTIPEEMEKNVFVYYRLKNFYQNHRRYIKSKSNKQLKGEILEEKDIKDDCDPIILNKDLYDGIKSINTTNPNNTLDPEGVAHPCGLIAKSYFNDTYTLKKQTGGGDIQISEEGIAWSIDKKKFKNSANINIQWKNVESERFIVWMRPAALSDFRKPWGKIDTNLKKGEYTLSIYNNYPVKSFDGEKYFILSTVNALGGKNYFLAILYLVVGGISIASGILFFIGHKKYNSDNEKTQKKD